MAVELVSQAEYAKRRGCSAVAVHKAVKAGRISLIDGKIDPAVADVQWARNSRARAGSKPAEDRRNEGGGGGDSETGYLAQRVRRETIEADLAELKLAEQRGDLLRASVVQATVAKLAAGLREGLLQIPPRLAPVLAAETDAAKVQDTLAAALRQVMEQAASEDPQRKVGS